MTSQKSKGTTELGADGALCRLVQKWLPGYLGDELTAVQQRQVQAHLAQCNRCAQRVQEARLLHGDLQAEADHYRPHLSQNASLHIQKRVHRRMQRSLMWQRTARFVQISTAVTVLTVLLAGTFLFSRFWLPFLTSTSLTSTSAERPVAGENVTLPEVPQPIATAVVTLQPVKPVEELPSSNVLETDNGRINSWDKWQSVTPGQSPDQLAVTLVTAALERNEPTLNDLLVGQGATQGPTARLWLLFSHRCQWSVSSSNDLQFVRRPIPLANIATIIIQYDGKEVGEIKMRRVNGNWFATFTRPPAFNQCLLDQYKNRS